MEKTLINDNSLDLIAHSMKNTNEFSIIQTLQIALNELNEIGNG